METTKQLVPTAPSIGSSSRGWLSGRRGLIFGGGALVVLVALALSQHWLTLAGLLPLLIVLPCAVMMVMMVLCMNHRQQTGGAQTCINPDASTHIGGTPG
jgi:hypothetical protein